MKNLFLVYFLSLAFINISFGQRHKASDFANLGVEHNRLLDVAYQTIISKKITNANKRDLIPVLQNALQDTEGYAMPDLELGMQNLSNIGQQSIAIDKNFYTFINSSKIDKLALPYHDKLFSIVMTENTSSKDLNSAVEKLETEIFNDIRIDNENLLLFYSGSNVAKYSTKYWEDNLDNWIALNPSNQSLAKNGRRRIVGADVVGGIAGAVGAAIVNVLPGYGQVAYGSAILAGAVGASICEAGNQLMDWIGW